MTIIFLNGCSSAGKSSIARCLQTLLDTPYLLTGIDDALRKVPAEYHNNPAGFQFVESEEGLVKLAVGEFGVAMLRAHQSAVASMARSGADLILDEVIFAEALRLGWESSLADLDVFFVGVHCALEELERRELTRGDRVPGQARGQFDRVHRGMRYHYEVDSTRTPPEALASSIVAQRASW